MLLDVPEPVWNTSTGKARIEFARGHAPGGDANRFRTGLGHRAEGRIGLSAGGLDQPQRAQEGPRHAPP
jgi:hypothetical protein